MDGQREIGLVEKKLHEKLFGNVTSTTHETEKVVPIIKNHDLVPKWKDDDDDEIVVNLNDQSRLRKLRKTEEESDITGADFQQRLHQQFTKKHVSTSWANITNTMESTTDQSDNESDDETFLLRSTNKMMGESKKILPSGTLDIYRVKDANQQAVSKSVIQSVRFHPNGQILLTAGFDKTLRLFEIDGNDNRKIQSIHLSDLPIKTAEFSADGDRIFCGGPRSYYYCYDFEYGKVNKIPRIMGKKEKKLDQFSLSKDGKYIVFRGEDGYMPLICAKSGQWITDIKMNGRVNSFSFSNDSQYLYSTGSDGDIYTWDMNTRRCIHRHIDEGSLGNSAIAVGSTSSGYIYASGSDSGVVNIYDTTSVNQSLNPKPLKALMHLTTPVDNLSFNVDSQILAMSSKHIKDSLKLVHIPSFTVFSNWPTANTPLHYVSSLDFSPSSGYFACGNDRGRVLLYRLKHYTST